MYRLRVGPGSHVACVCRKHGWLDVRLHKTGRHAAPAEPAKAAPELAPHDSASDLTIAGRASKRLKAMVAPLGPKTPRRCGNFYAYLMTASNRASFVLGY